MNPLPEHSWNAWSPDELHARLGHWRSEWYVVGGWALELWHGHQIRAHDDLEFAVLPAGIEALALICSGQGNSSAPQVIADGRASRSQQASPAGRPVSG